MSSTRSRRKAQQPAPEDAEMEDAPPVVKQEVDSEDQNVQNDQDDQVEAATAADAMEEDGSAAGGEEVEGDDEEEEMQRVRLLPGSTPMAASFEFIEEGHTLGNALRFIIMKNPDVEFCAYAIPHPSEAKMNVRIQTYEGTAVEALEKGLRDLQDLCDVVSDKYWTARNEFVESVAAQ